jgi:hypothetical protein
MAAMRSFEVLVAVIVLGLAGSAQAAVKLYSSDRNNGERGDQFRISIGTCPPVVSTPDTLGGYIEISDDGLGTVTLEQFLQCCGGSGITDLGPSVLNPLFGPGSFIFILGSTTQTISAPHASLSSGIGTHGPSGTAPGQSAEWGVVSGFELTGFTFCVSSPVDICNENNFSHGATIQAMLASNTYNLGTWNFDAVGDLEAAAVFITATNNGGLSNNQQLIQGTFQGASLPALPLVGFTALALGLLTIGGRSLLGRR